MNRKDGQNLEGANTVNNNVDKDDDLIIHKEQADRDEEQKDEGVLVGTSKVSPGSTTVRRRNAMPLRRRCPPAGGGATTPYVEKGAGRGVVTR
jgi:hypothetical protein